MGGYCFLQSLHDTLATEVAVQVMMRGGGGGGGGGETVLGHKKT